MDVALSLTSNIPMVSDSHDAIPERSYLPTRRSEATWPLWQRGRTVSSFAVVRRVHVCIKTRLSISWGAAALCASCSRSANPPSFHLFDSQPLAPIGLCSMVASRGTSTSGSRPSLGAQAPMPRSPRATPPRLPLTSTRTGILPLVPPSCKSLPHKPPLAAA